MRFWLGVIVALCVSAVLAIASDPDGLCSGESRQAVLDQRITKDWIACVRHPDAYILADHGYGCHLPEKDAIGALLRGPEK